MEISRRHQMGLKLGLCIACYLVCAMLVAVLISLTERLIIELIDSRTDWTEKVVVEPDRLNMFLHPYLHNRSH